MKYVFILVAAVALGLLAWLALKPAAAPELAPLPPMEASAGDWFSAPPEAGSEPVDAGAESTADDEYSDIELDPEAIASLRGERLLGDPRAPPIERSAPGEAATAEELADPAKYAEYESRQEKKLKRAYVIEAEKYLEQLRSDVDKGRAMGIPPDEIAKVEKKIEGIAKMREQLLKDDPTLLSGSQPQP
jgi:hypothetical protein